jgi:anti-sigma factor RsiW
VSAHLGALAAALVDDQLDGVERDRALRHVASCDACRAEVEAQRRMKLRLDRMSDPFLPNTLLDRLQSLAPPSGQPYQRSDLPMAGSQPLGNPHLLTAGLAPAVALAPPARVGSASPARRRARRTIVGAASLLLLGGGVAYAAGGPAPGGGAPVQPAVDVYAVQHGTTSGAIPLHDPAVSAVTVGFRR